MVLSKKRLTVLLRTKIPPPVPQPDEPGGPRIDPLRPPWPPRTWFEARVQLTTQFVDASSAVQNSPPPRAAPPEPPAPKPLSPPSPPSATLPHTVQLVMSSAPWREQTAP